MNTWGTSVLGFVAVGLFVSACGGGAATPPANAPSSTTTSSGEAPKETAREKPAPVKEEAAPKEVEATPAAAPAPAAEPVAEPCDGEWICLRIENGKVTKRATRLIGDPKIDATWSKNTDGRSPASFDEASHPVDLVLKHLPGKPGQHLAQIVLKPKSGGGEIVLDKRDGEDFGYVGVIAAEQDGAFLIDLRYMK